MEALKSTHHQTVTVFHPATVVPKQLSDPELTSSFAIQMTIGKK